MSRPMAITRSARRRSERFSASRNRTSERLLILPRTTPTSGKTSWFTYTNGTRRTALTAAAATATSGGSVIATTTSGRATRIAPTRLAGR